MLITAFVSIFLNQGASKPEALIEHLGGFHRSVSTTNPGCQRLFDQGLACIYGFQYRSARRSFQQAADLDPQCAMAYWGLALSYGPFINAPEVDQTSAEGAIKALHQAALAKGVSPVETALILAQGKRFSVPAPKNRSDLDRNYADAMKQVWNEHPDDPDVGALYAEAVIDERPWKQWSLDGKPAEGTLEALKVLEDVLKLNPNHLEALHMYIHALESSPHPERALKAADTLQNLWPDLAHLQHMPSHIYARTGLWEKAVNTNIRAIATQNAYESSRGFKARSFPNVDHYGEMLAYEASMRGQSSIALQAIDIKGFTPEWLAKNAADMDGDLAFPLEIQQRFGKWKDILSTPDFSTNLPLSRAIRAGARAVAFAATNQIDEAEKEKSRFEVIRKAIPADKGDGLNRYQDILDVESHLVSGEILIHKAGKEDQAIQEMSKAVAAEDKLAYSEPPEWLQPTRHTLGAGLLHLGRYKDAELVFREDLRRLPHNGWSLLGLSKALQGEGRDQEAAEFRAQFRAAWKNADITIDSPCLCLHPKS